MSWFVCHHPIRTTIAEEAYSTVYAGDLLWIPDMFDRLFLDRGYSATHATEEQLDNWIQKEADLMARNAIIFDYNNDLKNFELPNGYDFGLNPETGELLFRDLSTGSIVTTDAMLFDVS